MRNSGLLSSQANSAAPVQAAEAEATAKVRLRSSPVSTAGTGCRDDLRRAAAARTRPPVEVPSVAADVQPQSLPLVRPRTSSAMPAAKPTVPSGSGNRRCALVRSGSPRSPAAISRTPAGTLIRNTERHPKASTSTPPRAGPAAVASEPAAPQAPMAAARPAGGVAASSRPRAAGIMPAAAAPCTARAATSHERFGAAAHRADAAVKTVSATRKTRLRPKASARRPTGVSRAANSTA